MFYVSPALTTLMLALVPPVSLGVVRWLARSLVRISPPPGVLRPLPEKIVKSNTGSPRRNEQGQNQHKMRLEPLSHPHIGRTGVTGCTTYCPGFQRTSAGT